MVNHLLKVREKGRAKQRRLPVSVAAFLFMIGKQKSTAGPFLKRFKLLALLLILAIIVACFFWWQRAVSPLNSSSDFSQTFVIKKGENFSSIAVRLQEANLIKSDLAFKIFILSKGLSAKIQAGSFSLSPNLSAGEIAYILTHGTSDIWLTFPEGWRREEFTQRLASNLDNFNSRDFLQLTEGQEGELFPDTYLIPKEVTASAVLNLFRNNFSSKFNIELERVAAKAGLTKKQVLILASLVEREARYDQDRVIVAGILIKRWQNDWPLQVDATIQYALAKEQNWWPQISKKDMALNSPYNTYKYGGLPPTPICNPGLASIKAVVYPRQTDYWFYLSDKRGRMHYAKTNEEHSVNIRKYLVD